MTTKVRQCEDNIKKLNKISFNSNIESGIKDNIQINLVDKLRTFTTNFRKNEYTIPSSQVPLRRVPRLAPNCRYARSALRKGV